MKEQKKNEELQSRRDFFKNAAKGALPILGAVILASNPIVSHAAESMDPMGCRNGCYTTCSGSCKGGCSTRCENVCTGCGSACQNGCAVGCTGGCTGCRYK